MKKIFTLLSVAAISVSAVMAEDAETVFTYDPGDSSTQSFGFGRLVDNDAAILVKNPAYIGYEIIGISVDVPVVEDCEVSNVGKGWITSKLTVNQEDYTNEPDITTTTGDIINIGTEENPVYRMDITFPEPYTLTEEGVYVGYTLTVTKLKSYTQKYPLAYADMKGAPVGSFYAHAGYTPGGLPALPRNKEFLDYALDKEAVLTMRVLLRGHQEKYSGEIKFDGNIANIQGSTKEVTATYYNYGTEAADAISYVITISSDETTVSTESANLSFETPVAGDESAAVTVPVNVPENRGDYIVTVEVDKINDNVIPAPLQNSVSLFARPWLTTKRVLAEDYSGEWCGYCPEATVTLLQLADIYPNAIIPVVYHFNDSMQCIPYSEWPDTKAGTPQINFDRTADGVSYSVASIIVKQQLSTLAPADIDIKLEWADADKSVLRPTATLHFLENAEPNQYKIAYIMVEDDMSDPDWKQRNYYYNESPSNPAYSGPYWDMFVGKPYDISGLTFNETALVSSNTLGIPDSLPDAIESDETVSHYDLLALNKATCSYTSGAGYGKNIIKNPDKLRVVGILIDSKSGRAVNVNTSGYSGDADIYNPNTTGVENLPDESTSEVVKEEYFSLDGLRLSEMPDSGMVIIRTIFADGSVKTAKIMQ